jgi:hypothetical protein
MINKDMNTDEPKEQPEVTPDEYGGFYFSSFLKITDPETKEILVQTRGD